jgi:hypothetical protein
MNVLIQTRRLFHYLKYTTSNFPIDQRLREKAAFIYTHQTKNSRLVLLVLTLLLRLHYLRFRYLDTQNHVQVHQH